MKTSFDIVKVSIDIWAFMYSVKCAISCGPNYACWFCSQMVYMQYDVCLFFCFMVDFACISHFVTHVFDLVALAE